MSERRIRRWYEALSSIKVKSDRPDYDMQKLFDRGKKAHYQIEARLRNIRDEEPKTFTDLSLPFDIVFHPDLYDTKNQIVYDIKPAVWLANNLSYCIAQLSGYKHFLGARACGFAQYEFDRDGNVQGPWFTFVPREILMPWEQLRAIALTSDEQLLAAQPV